MQASRAPRLEWGRTEVIADLPPMQRGPAKVVDILHARSDLFDAPVLLTSDLHKDTLRVFEHVTRLVTPRDWAVIACGDMAGTASWGENADPAAAYAFVLEHFAGLHYVLGNHDVSSAALEQLANRDGVPCWIDRAPRVVGGRRVCGVSGIIGKPTRNNRRSADAFVAAVGAALGAKAQECMLVTHETPLVPGFHPAIRQTVLTDVVRELRPRAHVFGHCHLEPVAVQSGGTVFFSADRRVALLAPV